MNSVSVRNKYDLYLSKTRIRATKCEGTRTKNLDDWVHAYSPLSAKPLELGSKTLFSVLPVEFKMDRSPTQHHH